MDIKSEQTGKFQTQEQAVTNQLHEYCRYCAKSHVIPRMLPPLQRSQTHKLSCLSFSSVSVPLQEISLADLPLNRANRHTRSHAAKLHDIWHNKFNTTAVFTV